MLMWLDVCRKALAVRVPGRRGARSRLAILSILAAVLFLGATPEARADCALIPAALRLLNSGDGAVDRPFAAPDDTVTVFSNSSCKPDPEAVHFDPVAINNMVTLEFLPPGTTGLAKRSFPSCYLVGNAVRQFNFGSQGTRTSFTCQVRRSVGEAGVYVGTAPSEAHELLNKGVTA